MSNFIFTKTSIPDVIIVEPKVFGDERGYFMEIYVEKDFKENGIDVDFIQDNQSRSKKGVLRGLHFQKKNPQGKLVRCIEGEVYDVAVDLRKNSPTFGKWEGIVLSAENKKQFFIPEGFAHGFYVLSEIATFCYKCTRYYAPDDEGGLIWNDPDIGIDWKIPTDGTVLLSDKDKIHPTLKDLDFFY